jgi:thiol:disulfide interchange protein DsbD
VLLTISPGWHIYWINPGDSGLATAVQFELPPGFKAGPVRFPVPQRFDQPGNVVNFGYEEEVLLVATVSPPANLPGGQPLKFAADVKFLCCNQVCILGSTKAQLPLEAATDAKPANEEMFQRWGRQVPSAKPPAVIQSHVDLKSGGHGEIRVEWKKAPTDVQLFPGLSEALMISDISTKTAGNISTATFVIHRLAGLELKQSPFPMVVGYTDSEGNRGGLVIDVPISGITAGSRQ